MSENKSKKIKIIYIAGSGHCGSTLLDLIVGSSPEVFSGGELSFYNLYQQQYEYNRKNPDYLCTCKEKFRECPFWRRVITAQNFKIKKHYTLLENINIFLRMLLPVPFKNKKYIDDSYKLFSAIKNEAQKEKKNIKYILDSSKDPRRLFYLMNDPRIDIYPVFMFKNPRTVARSYINMGNSLIFALLRKEKFNKAAANHSLKKGLKYKIQILGFVCMWWLINLLCKRLIKRNKKALSVKYENFCHNPEYYLNLINKKYDINISLHHYLQKVNSQTFHNIEGNNLRFEKIQGIKAR